MVEYFSMIAISDPIVLMRDFKSRGEILSLHCTFHIYFSLMHLQALKIYELSN